MYKGLFVTIEGIDGVGKTTVIPLLSERLKKDIPTLVTSFEPGGTEYGQRIRGLLFDVKQAGVKNLHPSASGALYLSDHIQHQTEKIIPALEEGHLVIQDRSFIDSQRAYFPEGENDASYLAHKFLHPECVRPDLTILFNLEPAVALERALNRGDDKFKAKPWSNLQSLTQIAYRYMTYAAREYNRFIVFSLTPEVSPDAIAESLAAILLQKYVEKVALPFEHDSTGA